MLGFILLYHVSSLASLARSTLVMFSMLLLYDISNDCKIDDLSMSWKEVGGTS
jgi:hypothetical protein